MKKEQKIKNINLEINELLEMRGNLKKILFSFDPVKYNTTLKEGFNNILSENFTNLTKDLLTERIELLYKKIKDIEENETDFMSFDNKKMKIRDIVNRFETEEKKDTLENDPVLYVCSFLFKEHKMSWISFLIWVKSQPAERLLYVSYDRNSRVLYVNDPFC